MKRAGLGIVSALALCAVIGCGGDAAGTKGAGAKATRIVFVTNSNADWWTAVEKGMLDAGKDLGVQVEMRRNNEGSAAGQIALLEQVLSLPDVQGVAVSVYEAEAAGVADALKALRDQGKHVITIDSDITPSRAKECREAYIGTNNVEAGRVAGKAAADLRPEGGPTTVFVGTAAAANARERREGFFEGAGPKFTFTEVLEDSGQSNRTIENVTNAIIKDKGTPREPQVLLGLWSYNANPIADVAAKNPEFRKKSTLVTFDLDELAVGNLERGELDVTVCQDPYQIGFDGVKLLKALVGDDKATAEEMLPGGTDVRNTNLRVIVPKADSPLFGKDLGVPPENIIDIAKMKAWLQSKGLKSS